MKIRTDFVTNSSSNSFIVAWPKSPDSVEAIKEMIECDFSVCNLVFQLTKPNNQKEEASNSRISLFGEIDGIYDLSAGTREEWYKMENLLAGYYSKTILERFFEENQKAHIRVYEFYDSGSETECLCHDGEVFGMVPHILISNH